MISLNSARGRFCSDAKRPVLYIYEIQVAAEVRLGMPRHLSLGKRTIAVQFAEVLEVLPGGIPFHSLCTNTKSL